MAADEMTDKTLREAAEAMLAAFDLHGDELWLNSWALRPAWDGLRAALADSADELHCRICGKLNRDPKRVVGIGLGEALEATDTAHFCPGHSADAPEGPWKVRSHDEIADYWEVYNHHNWDVPRLTLESKPQAIDVCDALNRLHTQQEKES